MSPVTDHELCGSVGGSGVCAGQGAVQRTQPCNAVWMYRRHRGPAARRLPAVLPVSRPLRQDGCAAVPRESGEIVESPSLCLLLFVFMCRVFVCTGEVRAQRLFAHIATQKVLISGGRTFQVFYLSNTRNTKDSHTAVKHSNIVPGQILYQASVH